MCIRWVDLDHVVEIYISSILGPVGKRVSVKLNGLDVIISFYLPLFGRVDPVPMKKKIYALGSFAKRRKFGVV